MYNFLPSEFPHQEGSMQNLRSLRSAPDHQYCSAGTLTAWRSGPRGLSDLKFCNQDKMLTWLFHKY